MILAALLSCLPLVGSQEAVDSQHFELQNVLDLEYAADPRISRDGKQVVYGRRFFDVMKDRSRSNLWIIGTNGGDHRPLTTGNGNDSGPRWSANGRVLTFKAKRNGSDERVAWLPLRRADSEQAGPELERRFQAAAKAAKKAGEKSDKKADKKAGDNETDDEAKGSRPFRSVPHCSCLCYHDMLQCVPTMTREKATYPNVRTVAAKRIKRFAWYRRKPLLPIRPFNHSR